MIEWENAIVAEFEGLATLLKTWVPKIDTGETSGRRRREAENSNSLAPGHLEDYTPQLLRCNQTLCVDLTSYIYESLPSSRYSTTNKHIYLADVDQRTLFSLQAVINDSVMVILQKMINSFTMLGCEMNTYWRL